MFRYRLLASIVLPFVVLRLLLRCATGAERPSDLRERLGRSAPRRVPNPGPNPAPVIWLHAASNGELASAHRLVTAMLDRLADLQLVVTTNTTSARSLVRGFGHPRLRAVLAPLDNRAAVSAFLAGWRPRALVTIEGELWPNRFDLCRSRGIPVVLAGARLSGRTARAWSRRPALAARVIEAVRFLSAQDEASEGRFRGLGLAADRIGPVVSLKAVTTFPGAVPGAVTAIAGPPPAVEGLLPFPRSLTVLAASTHAGEEEMVLDAFLAARKQRPGLRLILAPRHPRRRSGIEASLRARGLTFRVRSAGHEPAADASVYLADTMGEMPRWYAAAGMTFVGGSLVERGGHTPFEPAAQGSAILHGPHVANFADAYAALDAASGAVRVTDAASLGGWLAALAEPARQAAMSRAAARALADFAGEDRFEALLAALARVTGLPALGRAEGSAGLPGSPRPDPCHPAPPHAEAR